MLSSSRSSDEQLRRLELRLQHVQRYVSDDDDDDESGASDQNEVFSAYESQQSCGIVSLNSLLSHCDW